MAWSPISFLWDFALDVSESLDNLSNSSLVIPVFILVEDVLCVLKSFKDLSVLLSKALLKVLSVFQLMKLHHADDVWVAIALDLVLARYLEVQVVVSKDLVQAVRVLHEAGNDKRSLYNLISVVVLFLRLLLEFTHCFVFLPVPFDQPSQTHLLLGQLH